jgi:Peptidase family S41
MVPIAPRPFLAATLAAILTAAIGVGTGCTIPPDLSKPEGRREAATGIVQRLGAKRDRAPHDNPKASEIDQSYVDAYASAETPRERAVALARLVDQFSDGHAFVEPPLDIDLFHAPACTIGRFDGSLWLEFSGRAVLDGLPEEGRRGRYCVEILEIDGYAPRSRAALFTLLLGPRETPVRLRCRMLRSASEREITLARDDFGWSVQFAESDLGPPPAVGTVLAAHPEFEDTVYATLVSEEPRIGLVRLPWMSRPATRRSESGRDGDPPLDLDCVLFHKPCVDLASMLALFESVADCDWVIVDLQGGAGGTCAHAGAIAAAIMPLAVDPLPFEHLDCPTVLKLLGNTPWGWKRRPVLEPDTRFAVLIDAGCASASEHLAGVLRALPTTILVGSRSAGSEYSVDTLTLPDEHDRDILRARGIRACIRDHRARSLDAAIAAIRSAGDAH